MQTRREATREATIREIKQTALARMRAEGTVDVRLSDVARDMRMSAPGLYRYFDGRDGLLTALVTDALTRPGRADRGGGRGTRCRAGDAGGRFLAVARAYRELGAGRPAGLHAGLRAAAGGVQRATRTPDRRAPARRRRMRAMEGLRSLAREADEAGTRRPPPLTELPPVLVDAFSDRGAGAAARSRRGHRAGHGAHLGVAARLRHAGGLRQPRLARAGGAGARCSSAWSGCSPACSGCPNRRTAGPPAPPPSGTPTAAA